MNYNITSNLPGILSLFEYSPESGKILSELAEKVLRTEDFSPIPVGYRELIAAKVSSTTQTHFCFFSHRAVASIHIGAENAVRLLNGQYNEGEEKVGAYMRIAEIMAEDPSEITEATIVALKSDFGVNDREVHDAILIASMFLMYNSYVVASGVDRPKLTKEDYASIGRMIVEDGYLMA